MANVSADEEAIVDDFESPVTNFLSELKELSYLPDHVWRSQMAFVFHEVNGEDFYKRHYLFSRQRNADEEIKVQKLQYLKEGFNKLDVTPKSALKNEAQLLRADIRLAEICLKGTEGRNNFLKGMINETRKNLENAEKEMNAKVESKKVERENARTEVEDAKKAVEAGKETNASGREAKEDKEEMEGVKESIASRIRTRKRPECAKETMEGAKESSARGRSTRKRPKMHSLGQIAKRS